MVYSDVINNNYHLLLPKKSMYTKRDVNKLIQKGFSEKIARFIVVCTAIFHDTEYSKWVTNYNNIKNQVKRMF